MAQAYTDPIAIERMQSGLCPECGTPASDHNGRGGPKGCSLTDNGVAQRIYNFELEVVD